MRLVLVGLLLIACGKASTRAPPRPEVIDVVRDLADRACGCNNDKECVRAIRDEWEPQKFDLQRHGLTGADKATFESELMRLRMCGDAAGLTIWTK
jgi:hypothetical protein